MKPARYVRMAGVLDEVRDEVGRALSRIPFPTDSHVRPIKNLLLQTIFRGRRKTTLDHLCNKH